jgi:hypothetical protein
MLPLIARLVHAFFFDERAARRWLRGGLMAFAGGGVAFADQLGAALNSQSAAKWVRIAAIASGFVAGSIQSSAAKQKLRVVE